MNLIDGITYARTLFFFQNYEYRQRGQCIAEKLRRILTHADIQRAFTNSFIMWEQSLIYTYIYVYFILKKNARSYYICKVPRKPVANSIIYYNIKGMLQDLYNDNIKIICVLSSHLSGTDKKENCRSFKIIFFCVILEMVTILYSLQNLLLILDLQLDIY